MTTLINALGPVIQAVGGLLGVIAEIMGNTASLLIMNATTFSQGFWMLGVEDYANAVTKFGGYPEANGAIATVAVLADGMSMSTAAFTVVAQPAVAAGGYIVDALGTILGTMPLFMTDLATFLVNLAAFAGD